MKHHECSVVLRLVQALFLVGTLSACHQGGGAGDSNSGPIVRNPSNPVPPPGGGTGSPTGPNPVPVVTLSAQSTVVDPASSPRLSWSSSNATGCQASGGWSGSRAVTGSATVGPISQQTTYTLNCSGAGGTGMAMLSVRVNGNITISWQAPESRVDGTPIDELGGFRIYYGTRSRDYTEVVRVNNSDLTQRTFRLPSGSYYFAMTAVDGNGLESGYSNEVIRRVN